MRVLFVSSWPNLASLLRRRHLITETIKTEVIILKVPELAQESTVGSKIVSTMRR